VAQQGLLLVALSTGRAVFVLRPDPATGAFSGDPQTLLQNRYGRLSATASAPDGLLWIGTSNKGSGKTVPSDDRVIRIQPPTGGGESRQ
jgi:hypothetical protein